MSAAIEPAIRMSRDDYREWVSQQSHGRYERVGGVLVAMVPERASHNLAKGNVCDALRQAVRQAALPGQVFADGMTIEIDDSGSDQGTIETTIVTAGTLRLDPPGVVIQVEDIYAP